MTLANSKMTMRAIAACPHAEAALQLCVQLSLALDDFGLQSVSVPKPYWKNEAQFEFFFAFSDASVTEFERLTSMAPAGWWHSDEDLDRSAVWNRTEGNTFLHPAVDWANVELSRVSN